MEGGWEKREVKKYQDNSSRVTLFASRCSVCIPYDKPEQIQTTITI